MKMKLALILVASVTFMAGYFLGCNQTKHRIGESWMRNYLYWHRVYSSQELDRVILILNQFREGNSTNGLTMLEKCLDGSLIAAAACDADLKDGADGVPTYIQEAHNYRIKYPWTNSTPEVAIKFQNILLRAK